MKSKFVCADRPEPTFHVVAPANAAPAAPAAPAASASLYADLLVLITSTGYFHVINLVQAIRKGAG